jgi:hypothetical protein
MSWIVKLIKFRNQLINDCNLLLCELSVIKKETEKEITGFITNGDIGIRVDDLASAYTTYYIPSTRSYLTTGDSTYTGT